MTGKDFFVTVAKMRRLQKDYFKSRTSAALNACKKVESEIDREIERVEKVLNERDKKTTLF